MDGVGATLVVALLVVSLLVVSLGRRSYRGDHKGLPYAIHSPVFMMHPQ